MTNIDQAVSSRKDFEAQLVARALKDDSFRQQLLDDPKNVLQKELGTTLPGDVQVNVVEEQPNSFYLVLPPKEASSAELSDADLEPVAGGTGVLTLSCSLLSCTC
ncbi:MAG: NHLP leader peptide family RiPP precursor [Janthinobacterium lividum]